MDHTFSIIKPDAVRRNLIGHINQIIEKAGLKIIASKKMYLTKQQAERSILFIRKDHFLIV